MKKNQLILAIVLGLFVTGVKAQLPDGTIAPNFTFTDMNGQTQDLYSYLNAGKSVILDVSTTWCSPCWGYHNSGNLEAFYNQQGPSGTDKAMVIFIEPDKNTTNADMYGTGSNTQGNWVLNTPYPMCNPAGAQADSFRADYNIIYFPTIYMICAATKKTKEIGTYSTAALTNELSQCPPVTMYALDAGISAILSPNGVSCGSTISPVVTLKNFGMNALTSCTINSKIDNNAPQTFSWTGSLASNATASVTIPGMTTTAGTHTLTVFITNPNGGTDGNTANDKQVSSYTAFSSPPVSLPISEGFSSGIVPPAGWALTNVDNSKTWSLASVGGFGNGSNSAKMDCFSYANGGAIDYLSSSPIDFSSALSAGLTFSVAHARFDATNIEALDVEVSADCGLTWTNAYSKSGSSLATAPDNTNSFTPTASQWRTETIGLNAFIGQASVIIRFKCTNGYGNNIYIDDINITSVTSVNELDLNSYVSVYPNPSNGHVFVNTNFPNSGTIGVKIWNTLGEVILESNSNSQSNFKFDLSIQPSGVYFFEISSENSKTTKKVVLNR